MAATRTDRALRLLSRSANKSRLWIAIAAAGYLAAGRSRHGVIRGLGAIAFTSAVTNGILKPLTSRKRPAIELTPVVRRLHRPPRTTSFPSGHAASAAAFTTGVAIEHPGFGAALAPVAAAVGYSRVHVGVHHTSDVVAGAALGAGIAMATQWWWPVRPPGPTRVRENVPAPALPDGDGLVLVVNERSGPDDTTAEEVLRQLPKARILELKPDLDLTAELDRLAPQARGFGAVGGDGTVAAVAGAALRNQLPLAVFPGGTYNHFARDLSLDTVDATIDALTRGEAAAVDISEVNGVPFLNTAVLGAYPEMVDQRDRWQSRIGKHPAMALAAGQVLRQQAPIRLSLNGFPAEVWTLFVGNGAYRSRGAFPSWRPRLDDGWLDVKYLRADRRLSRTRTVLSTLAGLAEHQGVYRTRLTTELLVTSLDGLVPFATDGEPHPPADSFRFAKLPGTLVVYRAASAGPHRL